MAGYPIEALKKAETITGLDIIPLQQNGITKQLERSIFDQAVIIKEAGSQSSGIIRKEGVFVLKNETQINFTLETAAGRIVEDNEYIDSAEAASGWIVYVVNTSGIQHTVIHDANSWPINAGEILCFYWTGSRFTLHNIVINNLTVRGDTKLLEVPAVQTLVAENKLAVIGADGKIISTTVNDIVELANVDGKINNALTNLSNVKIIKFEYGGTNYNDLVPTNDYKTIYWVRGTSVNPNTNSPNNEHNVNYIVEAFTSGTGNTYRTKQIAYHMENKNIIYIRSLENGNWTSWEKLTTETDVNNALTDYVGKGKTIYPTEVAVNLNDINEVFKKAKLVNKNTSNLPSSLPTLSNSAYGYVDTVPLYNDNNARVKQELFISDNPDGNAWQQFHYMRFRVDGVWLGWRKITTETDLANYEKKVVSVKLNVGSATLNCVNGHNYLIYLSHPYVKTGIYSFFAETNGTYSVQTVSEVGTSTKPTFTVNGLTLTIISGCKIDVIDLGLYN